MQAFTTSIPVSADAYQGFGDVQGILSFDGAVLKLAFQTADGLLGIVKSAVQTIEIPFEKISGVRFNHGFLYMAPHIQIDFSDFDLLTKFPNANHGAVSLSVRWRDRKRARQFVTTLAHIRMKLMHEALEASLESNHDRSPTARSQIAAPTSQLPPAMPERTKLLE
jgi:hypothetical protein